MQQISRIFRQGTGRCPMFGRGMFRRDEQAVTDWSLEHVKTCAVRQAAILDSAAQAVKKNGILVYSTCTFSKEENEDTVSAFFGTSSRI